MSSNFKMFDSETGEQVRLFPGEPAMSFGSMEEAKAYAEATINLRSQEGNDG